MASRALLTDPAGRVLLIRIHDEVPLSASDPVTEYWITVGGGLEAGESFEDAVLREIFEETGHRVAAAGPCIWRRRKTLVNARGEGFSSDEKFFWCPLASSELSVENLTDLERKVIREFRWWDLADPELALVRIFPDSFVKAAREVLEKGPPADPIWLG
jgi:8-oxo-dGTP pyrophosphatase MutT (NUDIX family)